MITSKTLGSRISQAVIWVLVIAMALICLLPLLNMVAISFSSSTAASANIVGIYPVNPTLESYTKLLADAQFWRSFGISVLRVVLGASLNVLLTILMAYPLSKPKSRFKAQPIYMKFLLFTMLFFRRYDSDLSCCAESRPCQFYLGVDSAYGRSGFQRYHSHEFFQRYTGCT